MANAMQDVEYGDLVVTSDFKGAGCWTAVPDSDNAPFLKLRRNGHDGAGGSHACAMGVCLSKGPDFALGYSVYF